MRHCLSSAVLAMFRRRLHIIALHGATRTYGTSTPSTAVGSSPFADWAADNPPIRKEDT